MHYPWWYVPYLTAPMLIAVGGGGPRAGVALRGRRRAVPGGRDRLTPTRSKNRDYLAYLRRHARFFVLLTVVFGAITGVGIWWTIGLASPLATEVLIRTFVFGWATEWVFFVVEIISAFIFLYYWGRLPEKTHVVIGWIYGIGGVDQPGVDHRHHGVHAQPGRLAAEPELLDRLLQSAVRSAGRRAHRRGAAA